MQAPERSNREDREGGRLERAEGALFDAAPAPLIVVGGAGEVLACNNAAVRALGPEARRGRISPWPPPPGGEEPAHGRLTWPTPAGAESFLPVGVTRLDRGRWVAAPTQTLLEDAAKARCDAAFVAGILHNVGNGLNGVGGLSRALARGVDELPVEALSRLADHLAPHADDLPGYFADRERARVFPELVRTLAERVADRAAALRAEVARLERRVDHVRETIQTQQRAARGRGAHRVRVVDVVGLAVAIEEDAFARAGLALDVRVAADLPSLAIDENRVVQILVNLLSNARHALVGLGVDAAGPGAAPRGVVVEAGLEGHELLLTVADNGVGIAPQRLPQLFAVGTTTRSDGNGVGLTFSARLAATLGARIEVASAGVGRGAAFTLILPLRDSSEVAR